MNTLRQAVHEYLAMRRSLGFRLRRVATRLLDFVTFMEQQQAPYITVALALAWAKQPANAQLATWHPSRFPPTGLRNGSEIDIERSQILACAYARRMPTYPVHRSRRHANPLRYALEDRRDASGI
jgi:hypothetical protein